MRQSTLALGLLFAAPACAVSLCPCAQDCERRLKKERESYQRQLEACQEETSTLTEFISSAGKVCPEIDFKRSSSEGIYNVTWKEYNNLLQEHERLARLVSISEREVRSPKLVKDLLQDGSTEFPEVVKQHSKMSERQDTSQDAEVDTAKESQKMSRRRNLLNLAPCPNFQLGNVGNEIQHSCIFSGMDAPSAQTLIIATPKESPFAVVLDRNASIVNPGRHFTLQPGATLLLKRINLTRGFMSTNGGAVYLSGIGSYATFIECAFVGNEVNNPSNKVFVSFAL